MGRANKDQCLKKIDASLAEEILMMDDPLVAKIECEKVVMLEGAGKAAAFRAAAGTKPAGRSSSRKQLEMPNAPTGLAEETAASASQRQSNEPSPKGRRIAPIRFTAHVTGRSLAYAVRLLHVFRFKPRKRKPANLEQAIGKAIMTQIAKPGEPINITVGKMPAYDIGAAVKKAILTEVGGAGEQMFARS